jgi:hypothetical protein
VIFRRSSTDLPSAAEESPTTSPYGHRRTGHLTDDPRKREECDLPPMPALAPRQHWPARTRTPPCPATTPMMTHPRTPSVESRAPAPPDAQPPLQAGSIHRRLRRRLHRRRPGKPAPPAQPHAHARHRRSAQGAYVISRQIQGALSLSKLVKDGSWTSTQVLWVGSWAVRKTIELPPHRKERLLDVFKSLKGKQRQQEILAELLGELRFASIGSRQPRSLLHPPAGPVEIRQAACACHAGSQVPPESFERLVRDLTERPTRLGEIIPDHLRAAGAHDASGIGMGGVLHRRPRPCCLPTVRLAAHEKRTKTPDNFLVIVYGP